jgi:hypothetical protein
MSDQNDDADFDEETEQEPEFIVFEGWSPSDEYQRMQTAHAISMGVGWLFVVLALAYLFVVVLP